LENPDPSPDDVESTVPIPEDTPADTVDTPAQEGTPDEGAWRREYIAREQAGWSEERRQTHEGELRRIEEYRQQRGPAPSGPSPAGSIPRAEIFAAIGAVMKRLSKIWPSGLDTDPAWQDAVNEAAASGDRKTFLDAIQRWEQAESARVNAHLYAITRLVAAWPDEHRRRFSLMVKSFQDGNRGTGITVRGLRINQAIDKAFHDLRPFVPDDSPTDPAPDDGIPFTDLHPATREILLRHWNSWDAARRQRFVQDVEGTMRRTGYSEGNSVAFLLQTAASVAPSKPPALSPEEKEALYARMWPTPPGQQKPKTTATGPDIAKLVSKWPKAWRLKFAGLVGRYSNTMPLKEAMAQAYRELRDNAQEDKT